MLNIELEIGRREIEGPAKSYKPIRERCIEERH